MIEPYWTQEQLRVYYGVRGKGPCPYLLRQNFNPDNLAVEDVKRLHYTARHGDGHTYVHTKGGVPELTREFVAMLDGIPYQTMNEAVLWLKSIKPMHYRALMDVARARGRTREQIAETHHLYDYNRLRERLYRGIDIIHEWLVLELFVPDEDPDDATT